MKIWTMNHSCVCGKNHILYTIREEVPTGHFVYNCRSLKVKMDAGMQEWTESSKVPKDAKKVNFIQE